MAKIVTGIAKGAGVAALFFAMLGGCVERSVTTMVDEAPVADNDTVPVSEEASLTFRWALTDATLISPPIEIQQEAIATCRALGNDTGYMISIGIDGNEAVALFGCRGADQ